MKPDRVRREFRRLSRIPVSEGLLERARERRPLPSSRIGQRAIAASVALAVFAAAGAFAWVAFRPGPPAQQPNADESELPNVVRLDCSGQLPELLTPEVRVQTDGVLVHVEDLGDAVGVEGSLIDDDPGTGTWAFDVGEEDRGGFDIALAIDPGEYVVRCAHGGFLAGELEAAEGESLRIVDPERIWHDPSLGCAEQDQAPRRYFFGGELSVNPPSIIDQVIRHAVPGIGASDVIEYAQYPGMPRGEEWHFRVLRGGGVLARMQVFEREGQRDISVEACSSSKIGDPDMSSAGPIATTFEVPGFSRCDPYTNDCASVWVSQARYAGLREEAIPQPDTRYPSCVEAGPDEACSVYPDDYPVELLVMPRDHDTFVAQYGCGATKGSMCRLET